MKPIPFPGGKVFQRNETIPHGDYAVITFSEPGYFSHDNNLIFTPDLATGYFGVDEKGNPSVLVSGVANGVGQKVTLSFLDTKDGKLYSVILTVL
jgi:hypothetical protein